MPNQNSPGAVTYSQKLAIEILERLAVGETVRQICRDKHMPTEGAVRQWGIWKDKPEQWPDMACSPSGAFSFATLYARARDMGIDASLDTMLDVAADGSNDWVERETRSGRMEKAVDHEHVNRSKLYVDTLKFRAVKMAPNRYGDKVSHEHSGPEGGPIKLGMDEFVSKLNAIASRAGTDEPSEGETE